MVQVFKQCVWEAPEVGQSGEQYFGFTGWEVYPNEAVSDVRVFVKRNFKGLKRSPGSDVKWFMHNYLSRSRVNEILDVERVGQREPNEAMRPEVAMKPGNDLGRESPIVKHQDVGREKLNMFASDSCFGHITGMKKSIDDDLIEYIKVHQQVRGRHGIKLVEVPSKLCSEFVGVG